MIRHPFLLGLCLLFVSFSIKAQTNRFVIHLRDKQHSSWSLDHPEDFLSSRALDRRNKQHIPTDSTDLPVSSAYLDSIATSGKVNILYTSRWFNQVIIQTTDTAALSRIRNFPFVSATISGGRKKAPASSRDGLYFPSARSMGNGVYGQGAAQIQMHQGDYLHQNGYEGENMLIAVLDGGFPGVQHNPAFAWLRDNNKIIATWNFTNANADVYGFSTHGAECLSIMASSLAGEMTGSAPHASYILLRTEEADWEMPIEENNWVAGAEYADSIGADIISSSLGYNTFDDPAYDHTYSMLDGKTTIIARGAAMAAAKGMIVVNAAGNEGENNWKYILTPADADSILAVGAVNSEREMAEFSSQGPTADGRIKPDVASYGVNTQLVDTSGNIMSGSGTSFAAPVIAGLTACLWQAFPNSTNMEIINAIRTSSSQYNSPDNYIGYGIPNFRVAFNTLLKDHLTDTSSIQSQLSSSWLKALPNPFTDYIKTYMHVGVGQKISLALFDNSGRMIRTTSFTAPAEYTYYEWPANFSALPEGIYYLKAQKGADKTIARLLKL